MLESVGGFDWDTGNTEKCHKHGLTIEEVESLFRGVIDVFPDVGDLAIRSISARFMHAKEVDHYLAEIARRKK
jgi:uncharacterized DUF497 family protein